MIKKPLFLLILSFFAFMAVGCCPLTKLNVTIELDDALRQAYGTGTVQVDIVAVSPNDHQRWEAYPMTKYWENGDPMRKSLSVKTLTLDVSKKEPQTLSASDPVWANWLAGANDKAPPKLYVLAQLRGTWDASKDQLGDKDPRRQILPLGSCRWDSSLGSPPNIKLVVKLTGITTETQPKRDKAGSN
ncbi:MAG TPA: hypothetical protein VGN88_09250 [Phycisphaerae bacterium]